MNAEDFLIEFNKEQRTLGVSRGLTKKAFYDFFEQEIYKGKMNHIIKIYKIFPEFMSKDDFYSIWVPENLSGELVCLAAGYEDGHEWWGFEKESDAMKAKLIWG